MILGHQKQWQYLTKLAQMDKLPHALLFCGQEKLGKRALAVEFVSWIFVEDIERRQHPDFIFIEPEQGEIKISQIRNLIWKLSLKPSLAPLKAAIIDQAHCLNQEAQSCFLKTLEEPKGKTLLILTTEYPEMLLPTILSRVQKIKFYPVKKQEIENYLKEKKVSESEIREILEISEGKPGVARDLAERPLKLKERAARIKELVRITNSDLATKFQYVRTIAENHDDLKEILHIWLSYLRKLFLLHFRSYELRRDLRSYELGYPGSLSKLKNVIKVTQNTIFLLSTTNINPRLALENLMLETSNFHGL